MLLAMRVPFPDEILRSSLLLLVFATCIVVTAALQLRAHLTGSRPPDEFDAVRPDHLASSD